MASQSAQPAVTGATSRRQLRESQQTIDRRARRGRGERGAHQAAARWGTRAGVLVALGALTVAAPLLAQQETSVAATEAEVVEDVALPSTVEALTSTGTAALVPPSSLLSTDAAIVRDEVEVSRSQDREVLAGCTGQVTGTSANGELIDSELCTLWDGTTRLRSDAAEAIAELNSLWVARFGSDMCVSSGYRSLAEQRAVKARKGGLAAAAGRSNHGWGLAVDFCYSSYTTAQQQWLQTNGPLFGWENPAWAQSGGSGPYEPWHWEYTKGVVNDGFYYDS